MNLIKSKINFLAWLNSAICVSVVGGAVSSSTPVLAASLTPTYESSLLVRFVVYPEDPFKTATSTVYYSGGHWQGTVQITQHDGEDSDDLVARVYLQHINSPQSNQGVLLNINLRSTSLSENSEESIERTWSHPGIAGRGHTDTVLGILRVWKYRSLDTTRIDRWNLIVRGEHSEPVPEPTTIFGSALALGVGGWLKRKKSSQQHKTTSQH